MLTKLERYFLICIQLHLSNCPLMNIFLNRQNLVKVISLAVGTTAGSHLACEQCIFENGHTYVYQN